MVCDLHDTITIVWKSVIARRRDVRAKDRETLRCKEIKSRRFQVEHWLAGGAKELFRERQQIRRPGADRHHNAITRDALSIVEHDSLNAMIAFVQMGKTTGAAQFDADRGCVLHQRCDCTAAFCIACFDLKNAISEQFRIPGWKASLR